MMHHVLSLEEPLEQDRPFLLGDPGATVGNVEDNLPTSTLVPYIHIRVFRGELVRVVKQYPEHLFYSFPIRPQFGHLIVRGQDKIPLAPFYPHFRDSPDYQLAGLDIFSLDTHLPALNAGRVEQVVDKPGNTGSGFVDAPYGIIESLSAECVALL